jgi:endonuclease YncB( thermonuclease family)
MIFKPCPAQNKMDKKSLILLITFVITGILYYNLTSEVAQEKTMVKVLRVIDGDTIETENGQKIRLRGINTPEKSMPLHDEAKNFLSELILNRSIEIEVHGVDRYNRILAHVFLNGQNLNEQILKMGFGTLYYYEKDLHYSSLRKAEEKARENEIGIWEKSSDANCLELVELKYTETPKRCTNNEVLRIRNSCDESIDVIIKDDATHIYHEALKGGSVFEKNFSCIWNNDGDSIYVWDEDGEGLLIFYRY